MIFYYNKSDIFIKLIDEKSMLMDLSTFFFYGISPNDEKKMKRVFVVIFFNVFLLNLNAQQTFEIDGKVLAQSNVGLEKETSKYVGLRYLPEITYRKKFDSLRSFTFDIAGNLNVSKYITSEVSSKAKVKLNPYRMWARYINKKWEFRIGLQKIDFGAAQLLRPLQWFNQIDPRDPLSLTNGVYGLLIRHYFKNNAKFWFWSLYGNEKSRGLDLLPTLNKSPEIGGRYQALVPKGEIAISYHYRKVGSASILGINPFQENPEHRIGWDSKWDLGIGLWTESTFINRQKDIGLFTNQFLFNLGIDYTFGLGNGLNISAEHLISSSINKNYDASIKQNISAMSVSYPLTFFSSINGLLYHQWENEKQTLLINYQHQFKYFSGYLIAYYNPDETQGIQENEITTSLSGPGIQLLLVYNH
jgi:hypothetical protein